MPLKKIKDISLVGDVKGLFNELVTLDKSPEQLQMEQEIEQQRKKKEAQNSDSESESDDEKAPMAAGSSSSSSSSSYASNRFDTLEQEAPREDDQFENRLKTLRWAEQQHLRDYGSHADEYVSNLRQQLLLREEQLRKAERDLLSRQREIARMTVSLEEQRHQAQSASQQLIRTSTQLEQGKQDKYELQHRVDELMNELSQMDSKLTASDAELSRTTKRLNAVQTQLQTEKTTSESLQQELDQCQKECNGLRDQIAFMEMQLKEERARADGTSAGSSSSASSSKQQSQLQEMVHRLQTQLRDAQERIKELTRLRKQEVGELEARLRAHGERPPVSGGPTSIVIGGGGGDAALDAQRQAANPYSIHGFLQALFSNPSNMIIITLIGLLIFVLYFYVWAVASPDTRARKCVCPKLTYQPGPSTSDATTGGAGTNEGGDSNPSIGDQDTTASVRSGRSASTRTSYGASVEDQTPRVGRGGHGFE